MRDPKKLAQYRENYKQLHLRLGLCHYCPKKAEENHKTCLGCRSKRRKARPPGSQNIYFRAYIASHKEKGLCIYCPNPIMEGKKSCEYHIFKHRKYAQDRRTRAKAEGYCNRCWGKRYKGGRCRKHHTEWLEYRRQLWAKRKAAGKCGQCGGENVLAKEFAACAACRKRNAILEGRSEGLYDNYKRKRVQHYLDESPLIKGNKEAMDWIKAHQDLFIETGDTTMSRRLPFLDDFDYNRGNTGNRRKTMKEHSSRYSDSE